jgi:hypothetical protein
MTQFKPKGPDGKFRKLTASEKVAAHVERINGRHPDPIRTPGYVHLIPLERTQPLEYDKPTIGTWIWDHWLWIMSALLVLGALTLVLIR